MKSLILTLVLNCFLISLSSQVQIGDAINGAAVGDQLGFSVSLSSDGKRAAFSYLSVLGNHWNVQIYEEQKDSWMRVGSVIEVDVEDYLPPSITLSLDGKRFAIGNNSWDGTGQVTIYEEHNNSWKQVGETFPTRAIGDFFSLSIDGKRIAIGSPFNEVGGEDVGSVSIYQEYNGNWTQIGLSIEGENPDGFFGYSVSLSSDGKRLATGAVYGEPFGYARIYEENNGSWTQVGLDIKGEDPDYRIGRFVALSSDGLRLAISETRYNGVGTNIKIYEEDNGTWTQVGLDIKGEVPYDWFGWTFSLSGDGTRVAVGDPGTLFEPIERGYVSIYDEHNGTWNEIGMQLDGENIGDYFGYSVSLSSDKTRIAIGAPFVSSVGDGSGEVKVFELPMNTSSILDSTLNSEIKLKVTPNPSDGIFFVEFNSDVETLIVSDANGKVIQTVSIKGTTHHTINLSGLPSGVYLLQAKTEISTKTQKLIKL